MRVLAHLRLLSSLLCLTGALWAVAPAPSHASDLRQGAWSGGAALGFLGNTPDGTAFALNFNADYFINSQISVGPLAQFAFTGDLFQMGFSGQGKYWFSLPGTDSRLKFNLQAGLGFLYADLHRSDTSWLIPIGIGVDYKLNNNLALTSTFLLNFTDVNTGRGTDASVMPGLTFGVRF